MTHTRVVSYTRTVNATPEALFELVADPARQPEWDGNGNLGNADRGQRVNAAGDVFVMTNTNGKVKENHVVEFEEGRRIAWLPADRGMEPPGHLWRWEFAPEGTATRVTHSYDWSNLTEEKRMEKAKNTTAENLASSVDRLADLAERS
ncbi:MAG: SRPBCC family protein [Propionibacteriaceae bacterium]|nr:SRPBCC family protein [Propionibacteriaceae bacterium]